MKFLPVLLIAAAAVPASFGANKDIEELQRDVALLQDQMRTLNDKVTVMQTLLQQSLDNTKQSNVAILSMQDRINDAVQKQQQAVVAPVLSVGQKLEQMSDDFRGVRETVADLNSRIGKLDAKVADLQNSINILKNPPAPPPGTVPGATPGMTPGGTPPVGGAGAETSPTAAIPPAGVQADVTYTNAYRDYLAGKYDLALDEFNTYLKYFPTTDLAPNAQFYVGDIYYRRKDYDNAVQAFDAVLEHFSDNPKTADAHLMKGRSLVAEGKRDAAAREFRAVISGYPDSDSAAKARVALKDLGLSATGTPRARKR